jgi:anti-anti-sigma factor
MSDAISSPLVLDVSMTIYNANELKNQLLLAVHNDPDLQLDLSQVTELDSSGLQLLYLAKREATRLGHTLRIVAHSDAVREVMDLCNLSSFFGDPTLIPAQKLSKQSTLVTKATGATYG